MSKKTKKIVILTEEELRKKILRLSSEIFENGFPKLSEIQSEEEIIKWGKKPLNILL